VTHENVDGAGIWSIADIAHAVETGGLAEAEQHFRETTEEQTVRGVVVEVGNERALPSEVLGHVNDNWTELGEHSRTRARQRART